MTHPLLALDNQLCFRLAAAARAVQQRYRPLLDQLGLTYPQYLAMLALWEEDGVTVSALGARLRLDSGTTTPLVKRLEKRGFVRRVRSEQDGRVVLVHLTRTGRALQEQAVSVPKTLLSCIGPHAGDFDALDLHRQLSRLLTILDEAP